MKKTALCCLTILLLFTARLTAAEHWVVNGFNMSGVPHAGCLWQPGVTFGFAQTWRLGCRWRLGLEMQGFYAGSRLVDKKFRYSYMSTTINTGDLSLSSVFLELPLLLRYAMPIHSQLRMRIALGGSIALGVGDHTRYHFKNNLYRWEHGEWPEALPCPIDLTIIEDPGELPLIGRKSQSPLAWQLGLGIESERYYLELRGRYGKMGLWAYDELLDHVTIHLLLGLRWQEFR